MDTFIIESYKQLSQDSGDLAVSLLQDLLAVQIAAASAAPNRNVSLPALKSGGDYIPTKPLVAVNILWFLSLACSLGAALCIILVQEWIRDYLQRVQRYSEPRRRARFRGVLFSGIQRWKFEDIVEVIPTLLHLSLFLFFTGLCMFMGPINRAVMWAIVVVVVFCLAFYCFATLAPLQDPTAPYQTVLSSVLWRLLQNTYLRHTHYSERYSFPVSTELVVARADVAGWPTQQGDSIKSDREAVHWVLGETVDDQELENLAGSIPGLLSGFGVHEFWPQAFQVPADRRLLCDHISTLLRNSSPNGNPYTDLETRTRRTDIGVNALLALADLRLHSDGYTLEGGELAIRLPLEHSRRGWGSDTYMPTRCLCTLVLHQHLALSSASRTIENSPLEMEILSMRADAALEAVDELREVIESVVKGIKTEPYDPADVWMFLQVYFGALKSCSDHLTEWMNAAQQLLENLEYPSRFPLMYSYSTLPRAGFRVVFRGLGSNSQVLELPLYALQVFAHIMGEGKYSNLDLLSSTWFPLKQAKDISLLNHRPFAEEEAQEYITAYPPNPQDIERITSLLDTLHPLSTTPTRSADVYLEDGFRKSAFPPVFHLVAEYSLLTHLPSLAQFGPFRTLMCIQDLTLQNGRICGLLEFVYEVRRLVPDIGLPLKASVIHDIFGHLWRDTDPEPISRGSQLLFVCIVQEILRWENEASVPGSKPCLIPGEIVGSIIARFPAWVSCKEAVEMAERVLGSIGNEGADTGLSDGGDGPDSNKEAEEFVEGDPQDLAKRSKKVYAHVTEQREKWLHQAQES
ncbi:hypothetical protein H0H87_000819 [Tephrocybe sp. NHM501043]|nr:hypothetical protein H0H87_000819 [Tephrocybe sp. NHM501043]